MKKSEYDVAADALSPPYNLYVGRKTDVYALTDFDISRTSQEFAAESDINTIMARYHKTGVLPVFADKQPFYVDATDMPSFQDMQNTIISAREAFLALPAKVREKFGNDPARYVEFALDEKNIDEMRELDMLSPEALQRLDAAAEARRAAEAAKSPQAAEKPPGDALKAG